MRRGLGVLVGLAAMGGAVSAQGGRGEQFYYPGDFNWSFRSAYPAAARLFNGFDYGHAVLYETLYAHPTAPPAVLEDDEFRFLTTDLLRAPPRFAVAEEAIMPSYSRMAWRAKQIFDWAHVLHRQLYDVYADRRIPAAEKDPLIERIVDYYLSNRSLALAPAPKTMALMDEQDFSQVFRRRNPRFNGLIWAYHWLQVGLYEAFLATGDPDALVDRTVARFWAMVDAAPAGLPEVMPMTAAVAPLFSERHPRAAMIFDNLHMLHDIISDVLASPEVAREDKARVIERQLDEFQDATRNVMDLEHWKMMGEHMGGVERMGGRAPGGDDG
jgi:hypothetical protein